MIWLEAESVGETGAPERIRTSDLCLRRAALYPAELRVLAGIFYTMFSLAM